MSVEAFNNFVADQRRRWIDGDEVPPPLPASIEEVDPRWRTPEWEIVFYLSTKKRPPYYTTYLDEGYKEHRFTIHYPNLSKFEYTHLAPGKVDVKTVTPCQRNHPF
ncbi:hypothetical protein [Microseira wollei]|uniref:Uncharacterized protein n=1 Tax=Microseira wollei NIES-4236 TaxID=2530354 RepID=A0AAV3XSR6_9CYAN|nr:hypothetical protein [Microseira wollei]GET44159.1 hypothetical protein MiSe_89850 [Microseira wollei NIES-4236]